MPRERAPFYSEAQALRGEAIYLAECARCHRDDLRGEEMAPGLRGIAFSFRWRGQSVSDIFSSVRSTMPTEAPRSLSDRAYIDVVAYLLSANEYPAGDAELEPNEAALYHTISPVSASRASVELW